MLKLFRDQLDNTATDIRLDVKRGIDTLGKEMESTITELRGTVSSLALQIECGISGASSAVADAADTAAQRHVDYLEWLTTLDTHRGQLKKQQSELESRLGAMLAAQKVSLEADIKAINIRMTNQHTRIAELDTGFINAHSGVD